MSTAWILAVLGYCGHLCLMVAVINRIHSFAIPRWLLECIDLAWYFLAVLPFVLILRAFSLDAFRSWSSFTNHGFLAYYLLVSCLFLVYAIVTRPRVLTTLATTPCIRSQRSEVLDLSQEPTLFRNCRPLARLAASLPTNQVFRIEVTQKELVLERLPPVLDGLTITHLSDLHLTGQLPPIFYRRIAERTNELGADLIAITGDIVEKLSCLDWLEETLGILRAPLGIYFVLGNHELRIRNTPRVRAALQGLGWIDLGGTTHTISHREGSLFLGGNELPWHAPPAEIPSNSNDYSLQNSVRILLSHSPDQWPWALERKIDLMLAGHTHGGQIRLPVVGPIFSPSRYGVEYCAGIFHKPPMLLHVTRGLSGTRPLRFRCAPEIARLTLRSQTRSLAHE